MDITSTIVAIASPPGRSSRGIVRVSGAAVPAMIRGALRFRDGATPVPRVLVPGRLALSGAERPLEIAVLALAFEQPHSYTGQDALELLVAGNPTLLERVVEAIIEATVRAGMTARRAEPGEFTARAFLNGRIDLTQAEGVAAAIAARSDAELAAARRLLSGALGARARRVNDELAGTLALVEAGIDFTDQEDVTAIAPEALRRTLDAAIESLDGLLAGRAGAERRCALPAVVLVGRPNAGKSSLFNALLGRRRTVVSDVRGTTRDVVAEPIVVAGPAGPIDAMLVDLPGIDGADFGAERQGGVADDALHGLAQGRAREALSTADLLLRCEPASAPEDVDGQPAQPCIDGSTTTCPTILVGTKADLETGDPAGRDVWVSTVDGRGLDRLRALVGERLAARDTAPAADALAVAPRQRAAIAAAREALASARERAAQRGEPELVAAAIRAALDRLGELVGRVTADDVIGLVFSRFCVGK